MTPELTELARRTVACKHFRWMPGMAYTRRGKAHRVDGEFLASGGTYDETCLPDLTDPATLGCLLALVREAHGAGSVVYLPRDDWPAWLVEHLHGGLYADTLATRLASELQDVCEILAPAVGEFGGNCDTAEGFARRAAELIRDLRRR